jgi:hypothetical protein
VRTDVNSTAFMTSIKKPEFETGRYLELPADLFDALSTFCEHHGYRMPGH